MAFKNFVGSQTCVLVVLTVWGGLPLNAQADRRVGLSIAAGPTDADG